MSAPQPLPPQYRYAGDDWIGSQSLKFTAWHTPPVYGRDGTAIVTPGVALDITGYLPSGQIYQRATLQRLRIIDTNQAPVAMTGNLLAATAGTFELTLDRNSTSAFLIQDVTDPFSILVLRACLTDPLGHLFTIGIQPIFVL